MVNIGPPGQDEVGCDIADGGGNSGATRGQTDQPADLPADVDAEQRQRLVERGLQLLH